MSSVCRVCRAGGDNVKLYALKHENSKRVFEKLTDLKFQCEGRPTAVCCICYKRLYMCSTLCEMALFTDKVFSCLSAKGLEVTYEAVKNHYLPKVKYLPASPINKMVLNENSNEKTSEQSCDQVIGEALVSVKIERMEEPQESEPAVCTNTEISSDYSDEIDDLFLIEPNYSSAHFTDIITETNIPADQSENSIKINKQADQSANSIEKNKRADQSSNSIGKNIPVDQSANSIEKNNPAHLLANSIEINKPADQSENSFEINKPADQSKNTIDYKEIYCCDRCKKKNYSRRKLVPHIRTHELGRKYCCDMCTKKFKTKNRIVAHIKRHNPKKLNICNLCGKKLSSKEDLCRHMSFHTSTNSIEKYIAADQSANSIDKNKLAAESANSIKKYNPADLSANSIEISKSADQSAYYYSIESKEIYCCDICQKKFYSRQKFVPHVRTHKLSRTYCCDICTKIFKTKKRIVAHIKRHYPKKLNICNLCGKKLSTKGNLARHIKGVHTATNSIEKYIAADQSENSIKKKNKAKLPDNSIKKNITANQSANSIESKEIFCCDVCKKKFYSRLKFVPHVRTHELSRTYCCDLCSKKFKTRKRIVAHIKRHINPKKLNICNLCGKKLSSKGNLGRHMNVHTGQKPYKCDKCNILFTTKSHLIRHNSAIRHITGKKQ